MLHFHKLKLSRRGFLFPVRAASIDVRYNKTAAAKLLGLSLRQLRYRIKKLGIE